MRSAAVLASALLLAASGRAQEPAAARIDALERKVESLSRELESLKPAQSLGPPAGEGPSEPGLSPSALKARRAREGGVSLGGYGFLGYLGRDNRNQAGDASGSRDQLNLSQFVLYGGYRFDEKLVFDAAIEFENAGVANGRGLVHVQRAYLDYRPWEALGARAGLLLVPVGLLNESHEPTHFHGVLRPKAEMELIPATWRENGGGLYGVAGPLSYRAYVLSGLQATNHQGVSGFAAEAPLVGGRSSGSRSLADDIAAALRVDAEPVPGVSVGSSFYTGQADQSLVAFSVPVTLWEVHGRLRLRGLELKGLYARLAVGNADQLSAAQGSTIGSRQFGGYAEAAFDLFSLDGGRQALSPFYRYERLDTQWRTPGTLSKDPANSRTAHTLGLTYKPIPQLAFKADRAWQRNQARTGVSEWKLAFAFLF